MTEREARRILAEHAADCPQFERWGRLYRVRRDGRVDVFELKPKTVVFSHICDRDDISLHPDVRRAIAARHVISVRGAAVGRHGNPEANIAAKAVAS